MPIGRWARVIAHLLGGIDRLAREQVNPVHQEPIVVLKRLVLLGRRLWAGSARLLEA